MEVRRLTREPRTSEKQCNRGQGKDHLLVEARKIRTKIGEKFNQKLLLHFSAAAASGVVNLFDAEPLGLFDKASTSKDILETWSQLEQRELKLSVTHPPKNYFGKTPLSIDEFFDRI